MKSTKDFAIQGAQVNDDVFASLSSRPRDAAGRMASFAGDLAAESARRAAMGEPQLVGFNATGSPDVDVLGNQVVALARQASALARADGQGPEGQSWGAFKTFFEVAGTGGKVKILEDLESMRSANPAWHNAMLELGLQEGLSVASAYRSSHGAAKGEARRPADEPTAAEASINEGFAGVQKSSVELADSSLTREQIGVSLGEFYEAVANVKMDVAQLQASSGTNWRDQAFSKRFVKANDIQFSTLANTLISVAQRAEIDPATEPKLGASITALTSLMSRSEAVHFAVAMANRHDLNPNWRSFAVELGNSPAAAGKWFAGLASDGPIFIPGKPEMLIPATVEFGGEKTYLAEAYPQGQQPNALERVGFKVGRILSGFVSNFRAPSFSKPGFSFDEAVPQFNASAGMQGNGGRVSLKSKIASLGDGLRQSVVGAIEQANAFTDFVESGVKNGARRAYNASTDAVDGAMEKTNAFIDRAAARAEGALISTREGLASAFGSAYEATTDAMDSGIAKVNGQVDKMAGVGARAYEATTDALDSGIARVNAQVDRMAGAVAGAYEATTDAMDAGIERANAFTDKVEQSVKLAASAVVQTSKDKAQQFVGHVGALTEVAGTRLGEAAFSLKDKLPGVQDPVAAAKRQNTVGKIAGIAGMLFVGVAMAPVVGVLAATAGGIAAGFGFASAARKAVSGVSEEIPSALESIGAKLGAKRQAIAPVRIEPSLAKPQQFIA